MTYAKVIADSISEADGVRLTTMEVRFHRFVLAEFNTHRVFSRNSASSRAIPLRKQLERLRDTPAIPLVFPAEQKGMQGGEALADEQREKAEQGWLTASQEAGVLAEYLGDLGVHKSVANRLLEPFMWHTVVVTATAWDNFFAQRCSPLAQPEIRAAAEMMKEAYDASTPYPANEGFLHLPYFRGLEDVHDLRASHPNASIEEMRSFYRMISAARCARTSYMTQNGIRDVQEDINLYGRLISAKPEPHWSPLEHVATPWPENRQDGVLELPDGLGVVDLSTRPRVGNFLGWRSLRTEVEASRNINTYR